MTMFILSLFLKFFEGSLQTLLSHYGDSFLGHFENLPHSAWGVFSCLFRLETIWTETGQVASLCKKEKMAEI